MYATEAEGLAAWAPLKVLFGWLKGMRCNAVPRLFGVAPWLCLGAIKPGYCRRLSLALRTAAGEFEFELP